MHLYFQSDREGHQMGLRLTFIQFVKSATHAVSLCCKVAQPSRTRNICPLAPQRGSTWKPVGAEIFPTIGNNYERYNKPP